MRSRHLSQQTKIGNSSKEAFLAYQAYQENTEPVGGAYISITTRMYLNRTVKFQDGGALLHLYTFLEVLMPPFVFHVSCVQNLFVCYIKVNSVLFQRK